MTTRTYYFNNEHETSKKQQKTYTQETMPIKESKIYVRVYTHIRMAKRNANKNKIHKLM